MTSVTRTIHLPDPDANPLDQVTQLNGHMLQQTRWLPFVPNINNPPFTTDQGWGKNEVTPLQMIPTLRPIRNGLNTTVQNYNAVNLNPMTYYGGNVEAMIPYGMGRGQRSSLTTHTEGRVMKVDNSAVIRDVRSRARPVYIKPSNVGKD